MIIFCNTKISLTMKKLLFSAVLMTVLLLTASVQEVVAQSKTEELKTYLQQLEVDKVQYKNDPARYHEYENKITAIKVELGTQSVVPNTTTETKASSEQPAETEQARMARTLSSDDYAKWKLAQVPKSMKSTQQAPEKMQYPRIQGQPVSEELYMGSPLEYRTFSGGTRTNSFPIAASEMNVPTVAFDVLANLLEKEKGIVKATFDQNTKHFVIQHNVEVLTSEVESIIKKVGSSDVFENEFAKLNLETISKHYNK